METGIQVRIRKFENLRDILHTLCGVGILIVIACANITETKNVVEILKGTAIVLGVVWALAAWAIHTELDEARAEEKRIHVICNSDEFVQRLSAYAENTKSFRPKNVDDVKIFFLDNYTKVLEDQYKLEKSFVGTCTMARSLATRKYCEKNKHIKEFCSPDDKVHIYAD